MAANLAILLFQTVATRPLLHTSQRLISHRRGEAGTELTVTGTVVDRYEKRGREYVYFSQEPGRRTVEPCGGVTSLTAMVTENHDYRGEWA